MHLQKKMKFTNQQLQSTSPRLYRFILVDESDGKPLKGTEAHGFRDFPSASIVEFREVVKGFYDQQPNFLKDIPSEALHVYKNQASFHNRTAVGGKELPLEEDSVLGDLGNSLYEPLVVVVPSSVHSTATRTVMRMESLVQKWIAKQRVREGKAKNRNSRLIISEPLLSASGSKFEFSDREESMKLLADCLESRFTAWSEGNGDRMRHPLPFLADGPGSGKSRFLNELPFAFRSFVLSEDTGYSAGFKEMISNAIFINVTFGNATSYCETERNKHVEWSVCTRILHEFHCHSLASYEIEKALHNETLRLSSLILLLKGISECVVLAIDEINWLYEAEGGAKRLQDLFIAIGEASCIVSPHGPFVIPVVAGTAIEPIKKAARESTHPPLSIPLPLLSVDSCLRIANKWDLGKITLDRSQPKFRQYVADMDGHGRALEHLYDGFLRSDPQSSSYLDNAFKFAQARIAETYLAVSTPLGLPTAYSFLPIGVQELKDVKSLDVQDLERYGLVKLEHNRLRVPFIFSYVHFTKVAYDGFGHWREVLLNHEFFCHSWEIFHQRYIAFRLAMFSYIGRNSVTLFDFFADCRFGTLDSSIQLVVPSVNDISSLVIDYPYPISNKKAVFSEGVSVLNGEDAPFDAFMYLNTEKNDRILVAFQMKWAKTDGQKPMVLLTQSILDQECAKIHDAMKTYLPNTKFFCVVAGLSETTPDLKIPENCILLSDCEMRAFYGPYLYQLLKLELSGS